MILDLAISPDETVVATGSGDHLVRLWSAAGELRGILAGHRSNIMRVRFTPAGDRIVTTSTDNTARLWSASGMLLGELTGHGNAIVAAAIRSDGGRLATASWDHAAMVWDLSRAQELRPLPTVRDDSLPAGAFDPKGNRLAVGRADGTLTVADVSTGAVACTVPGATAIEKLVWDRDDEIAVVRIGGSNVELWNAPRCTVESPLAHPAPIEAISTRSGPRFATATDSIVRVWSRDRREATFYGYPGSIVRVGLDGDDVYASTQTPNANAIVVDSIADPTRRRIFHAESQPIVDVRFDRARGQILGASLDQFLYIWDTATGALVRKLQGTGPLWAVPTSPDGSIIIGAGGVSPMIWDRATGAQLRQLEGHSDLVKDGEFLDDQIFVSLTWDNTAFIWDVAAGRPLMRFRDVQAIAVSDDRHSVAFISSAGVRIWSPRMPAPDLDELSHLRPR